MAINKGSRVGEVRKRSQVYSPQNKRWTKRGPDGRFMDQMARKGARFKGVRRIGKAKRMKARRKGKRK